MGILLWPAVWVHLGLSVLLVRAWWNERKILRRECRPKVTVVLSDEFQNQLTNT
jgi:hypothetical protein